MYRIRKRIYKKKRKIKSRKRARECIEEPDCLAGTQCCPTFDSVSSDSIYIMTGIPQLNPQLLPFPVGKSDKTASEVLTLPIGQGDCTVIYSPGGQDVVLFDCGSTTKKGIRFLPNDVKKCFENIVNVAIMVTRITTITCPSYLVQINLK